MLILTQQNSQRKDKLPNRLITADYISRGWSPVPISPGEKRPTARGWQKRKWTPADWCRGDNIGVQLGRASNGLADADLDCQEAIALAPYYLPGTDAMFGRASKRRSHWLYMAPGATYGAWSDPQTGEMLLELRADGVTGGAHQSVFPGSVHPCGELIQWDSDGPPRVIHGAALKRACAWLAIGVLIARYFDPELARRPTTSLAQFIYSQGEFPALGRAVEWVWGFNPDRPPPQPIAADTSLADLVDAIENNLGWWDWNKVGMAIWKASGGSEDGRKLWHKFSETSPKYDEDVTEARWDHYPTSPPSFDGWRKLRAMAGR